MYVFYVRKLDNIFSLMESRSQVCYKSAEGFLSCPFNFEPAISDENGCLYAGNEIETSILR